MNDLYYVAAMAIWSVWGVSWLAAALWSARTEGQAAASLQAPYRLINLAGWFALFGDGVVRGTAHGLVWHSFLPPVWHLPSWLGWTMTVLVLAGFLFAWSARLALGRLWSAAVMRKQGHRIVAQGPYALVRHPIYTALLTGGLALAAIKASPIALAGAVLLVIGYTIKARLEERFLAAELGEAGYAAYRARVPMLVPFARV